MRHREHRQLRQSGKIERRLLPVLLALAGPPSPTPPSESSGEQ